MSLYTDWTDLMKSQTDETFPQFWKEYSEDEARLYTWVLEHQNETMHGKVKDLADQYDVRLVIFEGFLDGCANSLAEGCELDPKTVEEDSEIELKFDFEKLYYNMQQADAQHLYSLPAWETVLTEETRAEITKKYRQSKIYHAVKRPGRNDPCWCGSGKKYKKCHMKADQEADRQKRIAEAAALDL